MKENKDNCLYCSHCGTLIGEGEDFGAVNGEVVCIDCFEHHTTTCDRCGSVMWSVDSYGGEDITLCRHCYENYYTRCSCCDAVVHIDDELRNNRVPYVQRYAEAEHLPCNTGTGKCYHRRFSLLFRRGTAQAVMV